MFERSLQPHNVFFVVWVGLLEPIQHLYLFETRFIPEKKNSEGAEEEVKVNLHGLLAPHDLNSNLPTNVCGFSTDYPGTYHVGEHSLAEGGENLVASTIELFAENDGVIPFWVGGRVQCGGDEGRSRGFLRGRERQGCGRRGARSHTTTRLIFLTFFFSVAVTANMSSRSSSSYSSSTIISTSSV